VVTLKTGRQLGGPESFIYSRAGNVVVVDSSGESQTVPLQDVVSMKLEGPRKLEFKSGDVLHVENIVVEGDRIGFRSDTLGRNEVPLGEIAGISQPRGKVVPQEPPKAEQPSPVGPKKWRGKVRFGYSSTSGREDTQNANLNVDAVRETEKTRLTLDGAARYGWTNVADTANAQEASGKVDVFFKPRTYAYWNLGLFRDRVNLIDLRTSSGLGAGRKFVTGERVSLEGELGVSAMWEKTAPPSPEENSETEWFVRVAGRFDWQLGKGAEFSEDIELYPGLSSEGEFRFRSITQLTTAVTQRLSLAAGFTIDYDNDPPEGAPRTSTNATTGFIYSF